MKLDIYEFVYFFCPAPLKICHFIYFKKLISKKGKKFEEKNYNDK